MPSITSSAASPFNNAAVGKALSGDLGHFASPFLDLASLAMPDQNKNALEWCIPPGALIEGEAGQLKAIEDINVGDAVLTRRGRLRPVQFKTSRAYGGDLLELVVAGFGTTFPTRCTPDHHFWRLADVADLGSAERIFAHELRTGDTIATPILPIRGEAPRFSGYLLGAYVAEGCRIKSSAGLCGIRFTFGADDETIGYTHRVCKILQEEVDLVCQLQTPAGREDLRLLSAYDIEVADWCIRHGGTLAAGKRLSPEVFAWNVEQLLGFLGGWIDGAGWNKSHGCSGVTTSKMLALQIVRIGNMLGMTPTLLWRAPRGKFGKKPTYRVSFDAVDSRRLVEHSIKVQENGIAKARKRYAIRDGFALRKIEGISAEYYEGQVHNIEVVDDRSFIADGLLHSNCEYIWDQNETYQQAQKRKVSYFLTDIEIGAANPQDQIGDDERKKAENLANDTLGIKAVVQQAAFNRECFHGDTVAITEDGVFRLRELAGRTANVLSRDGVYRPARFKSFGRQRLLEVTFSDGRKVLATPGHEWIATNCSGKAVRVSTAQLCKGYRIQRTVAPRPERNADYAEGVRHGFTFGDGSLYNNGKQAAAYFHGHKDQVLLDYFKGHGGEPVERKCDADWSVGGVMAIHGLPSHYKELPENAASASYWYGFLAGFLAADGSVDQHGCVVLTQKSRTVLEIIAQQLPRLGFVAGPVRSHHRTANLTRRNGEIHTYSGYMSYVTLLKRFVSPQDLLLPHHRELFEAHCADTEYGKFVGIREVTETGIVDEVYCCQEMETHTFVIDNGVLTGNCYGNNFTTMMVPFRRFLVCPQCGTQFPLREVYENRSHFKFEWKLPDFIADCPRCKTGSGFRGAWLVNDMPENLETNLKLKLWSPHEIEILHDLYTDDTAYIWRIPEDYKKQIRTGHLYHLERASLQVIKAIQNNNLFMFNPGVMHHMRVPVVSGRRSRGWGFSPILTNFRQIWYVQVLRRYNEAIGLDYIIPFRLITPEVRGTTGSVGQGAMGDPMKSLHMGNFASSVMQMIRRRRQDPAGWNFLPFPVKYQAMGGDASQLAPAEILDQAYDVMLNGAGTFSELYRGTMQLQSAPVSLRLYEATNQHTVHDMNDLVQWAMDQAAQILSWEQVTAKLRRVTHADDFNKQMAQLQLMMGQAISQSTGLRAIGINWDDEQRQIAEEARRQAELQAEVQEEMEQSAFGEQLAKGQGDPAAMGAAGGMPPGGAPAGGGTGDPATDAAMAAQQPVTGMIMGQGVPQSMDDMIAAAESLASQLLALPESQKDSELRALKQKNEVLHSLVRAKMDTMRGQAQTAGGAMLLGQQGAMPAA